MDQILLTFIPNFLALFWFLGVKNVVFLTVLGQDSFTFILNMRTHMLNFPFGIQNGNTYILSFGI